MDAADQLAKARRMAANFFRRDPRYTYRVKVGGTEFLFRRDGDYPVCIDVRVIPKDTTK